MPQIDPAALSDTELLTAWNNIKMNADAVALWPREQKARAIRLVEEEFPSLTKHLKQRAREHKPLDKMNSVKRPHDEHPHLIVKTMSDVKAEPLEWIELGNRKIYARGKVTLIGGDPGLGKSVMLTSDEAQLTAAGQGVVVFSAEDDAHDTMRPRYDVAGADVGRVIHVEGVRRTRPDGSTERHAFNLERDTATLRDLLAQQPGVVFVRIDPVTAYLGRTDSHKNAEVRALLSQLEEIAREFRVAIVVVTHLNKNSTGPALYRFVGSLAFVAACRLAFVVARDPENPDRRLLVPAKANITGDQLGHAFTVEDAWHEGIGQNVARVVWEPEPISVTLDGLVQADNAHRRHERERVKTSSSANWPLVPWHRKPFLSGQRPRAYLSGPCSGRKTNSNCRLVNSSGLGIGPLPMIGSRDIERVAVLAYMEILALLEMLAVLARLQGCHIATCKRVGNLAWQS